MSGWRGSSATRSVVTPRRVVCSAVPSPPPRARPTCSKPPAPAAGAGSSGVAESERSSLPPLVSVPRGGFWTLLG